MNLRKLCTLRTCAISLLVVIVLCGGGFALSSRLIPHNLTSWSGQFWWVWWVPAWRYSKIGQPCNCSGECNAGLSDPYWSGYRLLQSAGYCDYSKPQSTAEGNHSGTCAAGWYDVPIVGPESYQFLYCPDDPSRVYDQLSFNGVEFANPTLHPISTLAKNPFGTATQYCTYEPVYAPCSCCICNYSDAENCTSREPYEDKCETPYSNCVLSDYYGLCVSSSFEKCLSWFYFQKGEGLCSFNRSFAVKTGDYWPKRLKDLYPFCNPKIETSF